MPNTTRIINITGFSNGIPIMDNNGNVSCNSGDWVQWNCPPNVGTIESISYASGSVVFSSGPGPVGNSGNWKGQISASLFSGTNPPTSVDENYNITGNPPGGQPHSHDPRITVSPPPA
jgi:hypothetical protein